jgi:hypothetical protein
MRIYEKEYPRKWEGAWGHKECNEHGKKIEGKTNKETSNEPNYKEEILHI